jgi:hypothetical protein
MSATGYSEIRDRRKTIAVEREQLRPPLAS